MTSTPPASPRRRGIARSRSRSASPRPKRPPKMEAKKPEEPLFEVEKPATKTRQRVEGKKNDLRYTILIDTPGGHEKKVKIVRGIDTPSDEIIQYRHSRSASMPTVKPTDVQKYKNHRSASLTHTDGMEAPTTIEKLPDENELTNEVPREFKAKGSLLDHLDTSSNHDCETIELLEESIDPRTTAPTIPARTISKTISSRLKMIKTPSTDKLQSSMHSDVSGDSTLWGSGHISAMNSMLNDSFTRDENDEFFEESEHTEEDMVAEFYAKKLMQNIHDTASGEGDGDLSQEAAKDDTSSQRKEEATPSRKEPTKISKKPKPKVKSKPLVSPSTKKKEKLQKSKKKYDQIRHQRKKNYDDMKIGVLREEEEEENSETSLNQDVIEIDAEGVNMAGVLRGEPDEADTIEGSSDFLNLSFSEDGDSKVDEVPAVASDQVSGVESLDKSSENDDGGMLAVLLKAGQKIPDEAKTTLRRPSLVAAPERSGGDHIDAREDVDDDEEDEGGMLAVLMKAGQKMPSEAKTTLRRPSMIAGPNDQKESGGGEFVDTNGSKDGQDNDEDDGMLAVLMKAGQKMPSEVKTKLRRPSMIAGPGQETHDEAQDNDTDQLVNEEDADGGMLAVLTKAGQAQSSAEKSTLRRPSMIAAPDSKIDPARENQNESKEEQEDGGMLAVLMKAGRAASGEVKTTLRRPSMIAGPEVGQSTVEKTPKATDESKKSLKDNSGTRQRRKKKSSVSSSKSQTGSRERKVPTDTRVSRPEQAEDTTLHDSFAKSVESGATGTSNSSEPTKYSYGVSVPGIEDIEAYKERKDDPLNMPDSLQQQQQVPSSFIQLNLGANSHGVQVMKSDEVESTRKDASTNVMDDLPTLMNADEEDENEDDEVAPNTPKLARGSSVRNAIASLPNFGRSKTANEVKKENPPSLRRGASERVRNFVRSKSLEDTDGVDTSRKIRKPRLPNFRRAKSYDDDLKEGAEIMQFGHRSFDDVFCRSPEADKDGKVTISDDLAGPSLHLADLEKDSPQVTSPENDESKRRFFAMGNASVDFLNARLKKSPRRGQRPKVVPDLKGESKGFLKMAQQSMSNFNFRTSSDQMSGELLVDNDSDSEL